jgi:hypothetical protein
VHAGTSRDRVRDDNFRTPRHERPTQRTHASLARNPRAGIDR